MTLDQLFKESEKLAKKEFTTRRKLVNTIEKIREEKLNSYQKIYNSLDMKSIDLHAMSIVIRDLPIFDERNRQWAFLKDQDEVYFYDSGTTIEISNWGKSIPSINVCGEYYLILCKDCDDFDFTILLDSDKRMELCI